MPDQTIDEDNAALAVRLLASLEGDRTMFFENMTDDILLEFPYAHSVGMPARVEGRADAESYLAGVFAMIPGLTFRDVETWQMRHPDRVLCTYKGLSAPPGRPVYDQIYITEMEFRGGRISLFREYWDTVVVRDALGDVIAGAK